MWARGNLFYILGCEPTQRYLSSCSGWSNFGHGELLPCAWSPPDLPSSACVLGVCVALAHFLTHTRRAGFLLCVPCLRPGFHRFPRGPRVLSPEEVLETKVMCDLGYRGVLASRGSPLTEPRHQCLCATPPSVTISAHNYTYLWEANYEFLLMFPTLIHSHTEHSSLSLAHLYPPSPVVRHPAPTVC